MALSVGQSIERSDLFVQMVGDIAKTSEGSLPCAKREPVHRRDIDAVQAKIVDPGQGEETQAKDTIGEPY